MAASFPRKTCPRSVATGTCSFRLDGYSSWPLRSVRVSKTSSAKTTSPIQELLEETHMRQRKRSEGVRRLSLAVGVLSVPVGAWRLLNFWRYSVEFVGVEPWYYVQTSQR